MWESADGKVGWIYSSWKSGALMQNLKSSIKQSCKYQVLHTVKRFIYREVHIISLVSHWWWDALMKRKYQWWGGIDNDEKSIRKRQQWRVGIDEEEALTMQWGVINKEDISMMKRYQGQWGINDEKELRRRKHCWWGGIDEEAMMMRRHWQCNEESSIRRIYTVGSHKDLGKS